MNIAQIEANLQKLTENYSSETFIYDLLEAYGIPKSTISRLKKGTLNLSKKEGQIILKKKLFFQSVNNQKLHSTIDDLSNDKQTYSHSPRFIVVADDKTLLAIDTKTKDTLDIEIKDLAKKFDFFLPWAGMEKTQNQIENPADIKAAERIAKLYDEIVKDNPNQKNLHSLNVFLARLLFCFFAEDTDIFEENLFTNYIKSYTQEDGNDLSSYMDRLFEVLNSENNSNYPDYLQKFPYVNGGLFKEKFDIPKFSSRSRRMIIECGDLSWKEINPDIFGSMMQAVVDPESRGGLGMHYTSVPNIMKVIDPLFLDDLKEEFYNSSKNLEKTIKDLKNLPSLNERQKLKQTMQKEWDDREKRLLKTEKQEKKNLENILKRIRSLKIFDPACGSGNFLVIAYKELRILEMDILQEMQKVSGSQLKLLSNISLTQFYGIEIDDFACEIATLSLWLTEHQINLKFKERFGIVKPTLPLHESGKIICGNATKLNWKEICPEQENDEIYVFGNPPYLGSNFQSKEQKEDMAYVFNKIKCYKNLDYIACWFIKASDFIKDSNAQFAFVSTNSICQGEQVAILWPHILEKNLEINFAHLSFKWANNAKYNAGVTCAIIGIRNIVNKPKYLFKNNIKNGVKNINSYLGTGSSVIITKRLKPLSNIPFLENGNKAADGGHLIFHTPEEKELFIKTYPSAKKYILELMGSKELIQGDKRWCLWIQDNEVSEAIKIRGIQERINQVKIYRQSSTKISTQKDVSIAHKFTEIRYKNANSLLVPSVSSERREYIPLGFLKPGVIIVAPNFGIYDAEPWIFAVISSNMHLGWTKAVAGRLEERIRYSSALCYNTFPFPEINEKQKETINQHVLNVLEEREKHPQKTMADLYDPDKMPEGLRQAHKDLDIAIEQCYRSKPFTSDEERLEHLFKLYEEMTQKEQKGIQNA